MVNKTIRKKSKYEKYDLLDVYFFKDLVKNRFFKPAVNFFFFLFLLVIITTAFQANPTFASTGGYHSPLPCMGYLAPVTCFYPDTCREALVFCMSHRSYRGWTQSVSALTGNILRSTGICG